MGDFKTLEQIAKEMELERPFVSMEEIRERLAETPAMPFDSTVEEINEESARRIVAIRKQLEREKLQGNEEQQSRKNTKNKPAGYPHEYKPLPKANPAPTAAVVVTEQSAQEKSNGNGSKKPDWNTTGYPPIAAACGVTRQHIGRILSGTRKPSLAVLQKMASFYGVSMDEMCSKLGL